MLRNPLYILLRNPLYTIDRNIHQEKNATFIQIILNWISGLSSARRSRKYWNAIHPGGMCAGSFVTNMR